MPKKIKRGGDGFVGYVKKVKNERGDPLHKVCLGPFDGLGALGGFRIVSKKWTDQCEDCRLKKKTVTAIVGHFSLNGKTPTKKIRPQQISLGNFLFSPSLIIGVKV